MLGHHLRDRMAQRFLLRGPRDPGALGSGQDIGHRGLTLSKRTVVQVGCVVQILGAPVGIHLDVEHPPRDCAALARWQQACILNRVLEEEENARTRPLIPLVHENRAAPQEIAAPF